MKDQAQKHKKLKLPMELLIREEEISIVQKWANFISLLTKLFVKQNLAKHHADFFYMVSR
jgi:hypothetical protein